MMLERRRALRCGIRPGRPWRRIGKGRDGRRVAESDGGPGRRGDGLVTRHFPERYFYCYLTENFRVERYWWMTVKYGLGLPLLGIVPTVAVFWLWIL